MSVNRQKFMAVLSKWPITFPKKEYDYGYRLRQLLKNKGHTEEIFPGTEADNSRKVDALIRLTNNSAKNEFLSNATKGACGIQQNELKNLIEQQVKLEQQKS